MDILELFLFSSLTSLRGVFIRRSNLSIFFVGKITAIVFTRSQRRSFKIKANMPKVSLFSFRYE